jgi:hypothetical protein
VVRRGRCVLAGWVLCIEVMETAVLVAVGHLSVFGIFDRLRYVLLRRHRCLASSTTPLFSPAFLRCRRALLRVVHELPEQSFLEVHLVRRALFLGCLRLC